MESHLGSSENGRKKWLLLDSHLRTGEITTLVRFALVEATRWQQAQQSVHILLYTQGMEQAPQGMSDLLGAYVSGRETGKQDQGYALECALMH